MTESFHSSEAPPPEPRSTGPAATEETAAEQTPSEPPLPVNPESAPQLSPLAALAGVFYRPSRAFQSIASRPSTWWIPFLLVLAVYFQFYFGTIVHLDFQQIHQKILQHPTPQSWQIRSMPPAQLAQVERVFQRIARYGWIGGPLLILLYFGMEAAVLLAVLHYGFRAQAKLRQVFAVAWYASLPSLIPVLPFVLKRYADGRLSSFWSLEWTSLGHYLHPSATPNLLYSIARSLDIFDLWSILLATIGLAVVARTRRLHGLIAALVWWVTRWIAMLLLIIVGAMLVML